MLYAPCGHQDALMLTVAEELEQKYKVKTKVIDIDFSSERHVQQRVEADTQVQNTEDFNVLLNIHVHMYS